jgi:hypothetical protein
MKVGETRQLVVVPQDIAGNTIRTSRPLGFAFPQVPAVLTVTPAGLITATAVGTTSIIVTMQGVPVVTTVPVTITP